MDRDPESGDRDHPQPASYARCAVKDGKCRFLTLLLPEQDEAGHSSKILQRRNTSVCDGIRDVIRSEMRNSVTRPIRPVYAFTSSGIGPLKTIRAGGPLPV